MDHNRNFKLFIKTFLGFILCSKLVTVTAISGGQAATAGRFASAVYIQTPQSHSCLGTIVHSRHVITSAQCVFNSKGQIHNPFWYKILAGNIRLLKPTSRDVARNVIHIEVHPKYNNKTLANDLALLRVDIPFPDPHNTIEVASRNTQPISLRIQCQLVAWDKSTDDHRQKFFGAQIIDLKTCNQKDMHSGKVLKDMICHGRLDGTVCPRMDELGGGLYCNRQLAGILSFGIQEEGCLTIPQVYTDIRKYSAWIEEHVKTAQPNYYQ